DDLEWMGLDQLVPVDAPKNLRRFALSIINKKSLGRISQSRRAPVNPSSSTIALEDNALNFYTIEVLAEEWGWSRTKVLNYAADGRLEIGLPFSDMTMFAQKDNAEGVRENLALCGVTGILKPPLLGIVRFLNRGDWNESTTIPFVMPLAESPPKIYIIGGPEWEDTPFDPVGLKESMWPWASGITWEPVLTHLEGSDVDGFEIAEPDYAVKLCQFVVTRQEKARFEATNFPTEKLWGQDKHEGSTTLAGSESVKVDPGQDQLKQVEHIEPSGSLVQGGSKMDGNFNPDLMGSTSDATLGRHYRQHMKSLASKNEERSAEREIEWERWRKEANRINDNRSHPVTSKRQLASLVKDSLNLSDSIETIRKKI
ncbi:MAG: hypothetical protein KDJ99_34335, partial [Candidatus Competibacteraceae bacterium]|nr:hypothetical protein [Candidatus Competibacteraceae bacterium]